MKSNGVFRIFVRKCARAICSTGSGKKTASVEGLSEIRDSRLFCVVEGFRVRLMYSMKMIQLFSENIDKVL